jgi:hypothetical protein
MEKLLEFGKLGKLLFEKDWSKTPLNSINSWPSILKKSLEIVLRSKFPTTLFWGRELVQIPNEAFLDMLSVQPSDLEDPSVVCEQLFASERDLLLGFFDGKETTRTVDKQSFVLSGKSQWIEKYFTHSYSLIFENENVCGIMATTVETTEKVAGQRQFRTLSKLYLEAVSSLTVDRACEATI